MKNLSIVRFDVCEKAIVRRVWATRLALEGDFVEGLSLPSCWRFDVGDEFTGGFADNVRYCRRTPDYLLTGVEVMDDRLVLVYWSPLYKSEWRAYLPLMANDRNYYEIDTLRVEIEFPDCYKVVRLKRSDQGEYSVDVYDPLMGELAPNEGAKTQIQYQMIPDAEKMLKLDSKIEKPVLQMDREGYEVLAAELKQSVPDYYRQFGGQHIMHQVIFNWDELLAVTEGGEEFERFVRDGMPMRTTWRLKEISANVRRVKMRFWNQESGESGKAELNLCDDPLSAFYGNKPVTLHWCLSLWDGKRITYVIFWLLEDERRVTEYEAQVSRCEAVRIKSMEIVEFESKSEKPAIVIPMKEAARPNLSFGKRLREAWRILRGKIA